MQSNSSANAFTLNQWTIPQECNLSSDNSSFLFLRRSPVRLNTTFDNYAASRGPYCSPSLGICMIVTASMISWIYLRKKRIRPPKVLPVDAVHALSAVFTPTSSAWPAKFAYYFESASIIRRKLGPRGGELAPAHAHGDGCIEVDLSDLSGHVLAGGIELRDPRDLAPLLKGSFKIYAWNIRLRVGWEWWFDVVRWLLEQQVFTAGKIALQDNLDVMAEPPNFVDLDFIPFRCLEAYIRGINNAQRAPSSSITIEFSSIKSEIRFISPEFVLCAIALLPRWRGRKISHGFTGNSPVKTSIPLFIQLQDVVACIMSTKSFKITSITNISAQREASLLSVEHDLVEQKNLRTSTIRELGTVGWREERLRLLWEAGLIKAGLLHRWSIQLSK